MSRHGHGRRYCPYHVDMASTYRRSLYTPTHDCLSVAEVPPEAPVLIPSFVFELRHHHRPAGHCRSKKEMALPPQISTSEGLSLFLGRSPPTEPRRTGTINREVKSTDRAGTAKRNTKTVVQKVEGGSKPDSGASRAERAECRRRNSGGPAAVR